MDPRAPGQLPGGRLVTATSPTLTRAQLETLLREGRVELRWGGLYPGRMSVSLDPGARELAEGLL